MKDRYLFKAKRIDTGEWVEGFYFCMVHDDGRHIHHFIMPLGIDLSLGTPIEKIQVEIDENTLCQYTGLTDKNGNKIWENDVVTIKGMVSIGKVLFDKESCSYSIRVGVGRYVRDIGRFEKEIEVIGNIFDTPGLLKGEGA